MLAAIITAWYQGATRARLFAAVARCSWSDDRIAQNERRIALDLLCSSEKVAGRRQHNCQRLHRVGWLLRIVRFWLRIQHVWNGDVFAFEWGNRCRLELQHELDQWKRYHCSTSSSQFSTPITFLICSLFARLRKASYSQTTSRMNGKPFGTISSNTNTSRTSLSGANSNYSRLWVLQRLMRRISKTYSIQNCSAFRLVLKQLLL